MLGFRRAFVWETDRQARKRPGGGQAADTPDGSCIFDSENKLVYTDGEFVDTHVSRIIELNVGDETLTDLARSFVYEEEGKGKSYAEIRGILESCFGEGSAKFYTLSDGRGDARQNGRGKERNIKKVRKDDHGDLSSAEKRKYALKKNVEQIEDLVAVHNTTADKLKKALDLLGFPAPSIAVTKTGIVHSDFGKITLTFGRGTVKLLPPGAGGALPEAEKAIEPGRALFAGRLARILRQRRAEKNERRLPSVKHFYESSVNKYCNYGVAMI